MTSRPREEPTMPTYAFLSPEWIDAARSVQEAHAGQGDGATPAIRMNLVIEDVPFGEPVVDAHLDTTGGTVELELGHLSAADVKVSLDYPTARAILVERDGQAALSAFMAGKIRVDGDMAKLLAFQSVPVTGPALDAAEQVRAITR
jgi:hypothetical protein